MERLTGRSRYRAQTNWFSKKTKMVLQVETAYETMFHIGDHAETETVTSWRDAEVEDLRQLYKGGHLDHG